MIDNIDLSIRDKILYWSQAEVFDQSTRTEIQNLIDQDSVKELNDRFYKDLEFGTGGMRGLVGAGSARLNVYNIRKASLALVSYLKEQYTSTKQLIVAISYDSRIHSRHFAEYTAEVFAAYGVRTLITQEMRPVPMLSFMVRHFGCQAGVCITASHNPPAYNGFKVYWGSGGQLVPPHDLGILTQYKSIKRYEDIRTLSFAKGLEDGLIQEIGSELDNAYLKKITELSFRREEASSRYQHELSTFKIVYSALHGTGGFAVPKALDAFGFKQIYLEEEQAKPDGNFPTVKSPNPEDPSALERAVLLAKKINADIVLATDPDADRVGIVVREEDQWVSFNGNQMGCLFYEYIFSSLKEKKRLPEYPLAVKTVVTTDLQKKIAEFYGAFCEETLTGFKWIGGLIEAYESGEKKPYKSFVCGGEESYGFLTGTFVRDKDAVIACAMLCEMTAYYKSLGKTLSQVLDSLFLRHGVYEESLFTLELPGKNGAERIQGILKNLRARPPRSIAGQTVLQIKDYLLGKQKSGADLSLEDPLHFVKENMLQFELPQARLSIRPSGTEPKVKVYTSVFSTDTVNIENLPVLKKQVKILLASLEKAIKELVF
ncbi:MAG: phospho-sugar mutase [Oligoflexales bacterium]|nr:phospho-sugar mutase [Oligoflexales bacterium]